MTHRMVARAAILVGGAALWGLAAQVLAEDVPRTYGYGGDVLSETVLSSITSDAPMWPTLTPELRALAPKQRAAAVQELGKAVRAFVESPAFEKRWEQHVTENTPTPPKPLRTYAEIATQTRSDLARQRKESEAALQQLPDKQREALRKSFEQALLTQEKMLDNRAFVEMGEKARYDSEKQSYEQALALVPKDPNARLRASLQRFLAATADVDFNAKLVDRDGQRVFAKADYEAKDDTWKRAFRAGKEATGAARSFAESWLKSLK